MFPSDFTGEGEHGFAATSRAPRSWRPALERLRDRAANELSRSSTCIGPIVSRASTPIRFFCCSTSRRVSKIATRREAMAKVRREAGSPLDEDSALLLLHVRSLGFAKRNRDARCKQFEKIPSTGARQSKPCCGRRSPHWQYR